MNYIENIKIDEMEKQKFFSLVEIAKIDLKSVSLPKKELNDHFHKFNVLVGRLNGRGFSVFDIAMYLFEDYFERIQDVLNCFDENNLWLLKEEASLKYHKGKLKTILDNFLFM